MAYISVSKPYQWSPRVFWIQLLLTICSVVILKKGILILLFEILKIMDRRGVSRDADSCKLLIKSSLNKGEPVDTKTALDCMIEAGHLPDSSLFRSVMESLFEDGRVQIASRVMKSMVEKGVKENMDLVAKILEALLMRGHVEDALGRIDLFMHNGCSLNLTVFCLFFVRKGRQLMLLSC